MPKNVNAIFQHIELEHLRLCRFGILFSVKLAKKSIMVYMPSLKRCFNGAKLYDTKKLNSDIMKEIKIDKYPLMIRLIKEIYSN